MQRPPPTSSSQRYAYLAALTQEIEKKLLRALNSPSQRLGILQELFADIALGIDERASDIIVEKNGGVSSADEGIQNCLCFYDVLAEHYGRKPENGQRILDLIVKLWSQSFASHIFALLFHKWLFEAPPQNAESQLRFASALAQGATNVFWIDIQTNTRQFFSLFHQYLLVDVAPVPSRLDKIPLQARRDLFLLLSRFIFFYNLVDRFESFLKDFPDFPNSFLVGGPADIFVIELTDQLQKLKVEPVLLHYLSHIRALQGLELRMTTSTRLKSIIFMTIAWFMVGFDDNFTRYVETTGVLLLVTAAAASMGYFLSTLSTSVRGVAEAGSNILTTLMLFDGFLINASSVPVYLKWLGWISIYKWAYELLSIVIWRNYTIGCATGETCTYATGNDVLTQLSFSVDGLWPCVYYLLASIAAYRTLSYILVVIHARRKPKLI